MKRKLSTLALTATLCVSLLAGCGPKPAASVELSLAPETESSVVSVENVTVSEPEVIESDRFVPLPFSEDPSLDEASDQVYIPEGIELIKFSGKTDISFSSANYSAYESDKYILLVDRNVKLPGDYAIMLDDIMSTMEEITGLSFSTPRKGFSKNMVKTYDGETPWAGLESADKIIIQLNNSDRDPYSYDPVDFFTGYMSMNDCGLYTFPGEPVLPSDYMRMIHMLSLELLRNHYPDISEEGYDSEVIYNNVIESLEEKYPDLKRVVIYTGLDEVSTDFDPADTESVWLNPDGKWSDYSCTMNFMKSFSYYMFETYGDKYLPSVATNNFSYAGMSREDLADYYKATFGENLFTDFGEWLMKAKPDMPVSITLSGNAEDIFTAETNCYAEGENCILYIEKDVNIPGDYLINADNIVKALERKMFNTEVTYDYPPVGAFSGIPNNGKMIIYLCIDEEMLGLISFCDSSVYIYDYAMETGDMGLLDYAALAHESSHAVMEAMSDTHRIGKIMTEGSAEFYAECAIVETGLGTADDFYHGFYYMTDLNAKTAEDLFRNDFDDVNHANRGAEYSMGYYLSKYLCETFGDEFLTNLNDAVFASSIKESGGYGDDADREERTRVFKKTFGDDVFTNFGTWYGKNK